MSGTGDIPDCVLFWLQCLHECAHLEVKHSQGFIQVINEVNAVIQAYLHLVHQRPTLQSGMHIICDILG